MTLSYVPSYLENLFLQRLGMISTVALDRTEDPDHIKEREEYARVLYFRNILRLNTIQKH
jgi:hypothetical protein